MSKTDWAIVMNMVVCWFSLRGINCSLSDGFHYKVASVFINVVLRHNTGSDVKDETPISDIES